jgi:cbb3-type cytochrome oxidase maturation protein
MSVVYIALPVSLLLVLAAVAAFVWSLRSGQFDDLETPSVRLLMDDQDVSPPENGSAEEGSNHDL